MLMTGEYDEKIDRKVSIRLYLVTAKLKYRFF